jgi:mono/diheme cytochrome c family protein
MTMKIRNLGTTLLLPVLLTAGLATAARADDDAAVERGRYLVNIAGCNDCHTPDWPQSGGKVAQEDWLTGSPVGFRGPWGTTYPANLRLVVASMTEAEWLRHARQPRRPPMPWFNLRDMSDADLRAIYRYVRHLGPKGAPAPPYLAPDMAVATPYIDFVPRNLPRSARAEH